MMRGVLLVIAGGAGASSFLLIQQCWCMLILVAV